MKVHKAFDDTNAPNREPLAIHEITRALDAFGERGILVNCEGLIRSLKKGPNES